MKIAIYCVNYHSYDSLKHYIGSIEQAVLATGKAIEVSVFVADNSCPAEQFEYNPKRISVEVVSIGENIGYFRAVNRLMKIHKPTVYNYTIISNVDVLLSNNFFSQLQTMPYSPNVGWIAPQI